MKTFVRTFFFLFVFALITTIRSNAQGYELPRNPVSDPDTFAIEGGVVTYDASGNAYYASSVSSVYTFYYGIEVVKVNPAGNRVTRTIINPYIPIAGSGYSNYDRPVSIKIIGGAIYLAVNGWVEATNEYDAVLYKLNTGLSLQWTMSYYSPNHTDDFVKGLSAGPSNSILVLVSSQGNSVLRQYDAYGLVLNTKIYDTGVSVNDQPVALRYSGGNTYVAGTTASTAGLATLLLKYNSSMTQVFASILHNSNPNYDDEVTDCNIDTSGNIFVSGSYQKQTGRYGVVAKYRKTSGGRFWVRKLATKGSVFKVIPDQNANPIIYNRMTGGDHFLRLDKQSGFTMLDVNLNLWTAPTSTYTLDFQKDTADNVYMLVNLDSTFADPNTGFPTTYHGYDLIKYDNYGLFQWRNRKLRTNYAVGMNYYGGSMALRNASTVFLTDGRRDDGQQPVSLNYAVYRSINAGTGLRFGSDDSNAIRSSYSLQAFPNPAADDLMITSNEFQSTETVLELYSLDGKVIFSQNIHAGNWSGNQVQLNVASIPAALYTLKISNEEKIAVTKLLIAH